MADQEEQQEVMLHTTDLVEGTEIVTESQVNEVESEEVSEDILQQALEEAQEGFGQETVEYTTENVAVSQEMIVTGDESNLSVADGNVVSEAYDQGVTYRVVDSMPLEQYVDEPQAETTQIIAESNLPAANTGTSLILQGNFGTETPLGSSANPIRIVQQGNQYTSMQQLTPEQLSHIMQVVQQQQVARNAQQGGGSSVLFNPSTQTRIVYRVIHPQELHKNNQNSVNSQQLELSQGGTQVVQKRTYRKRNRDDEEKFEGPELSKEEKEERKKHRPRTRSGRVSRPPKHMVKEYKHIHPLDWDEDYDDSDGGYSDFKMSEEEDEEVPRDKDNKDSAYIIPGLGSSKPKNFRCEVCQKAYIGKAGLARHFRLNPSHGNADELVEPVNGVNGLATEDSSSNSSSVADTTATTKTVTFKPAATPTPATTVNSVPRGVLKARQQLLQESTPVRRKQKLRDLIKQCEDEELMEIVLPRLAKVITVWEFLLMKVEKGKPLKPHFPDVYKEFETLHKQVQKMCMEFLRPPQGGGDNAGPGSNRLEICDTTVAQSLGLNLRSYEVRNSVEEERQQFQYKLLTTDPQNLYTNPSQNSKRTIELVSQAELVSQPPAKRARVEESENLPPTVVVTSSSSVSTPTSAANVLHTSGGADSMPAQILEDQPVMESVDDSMPYEEEANGEQVVGTIVDKDNSDVIKQQEDEQTTMMTTTTTTEEGEEEEVPVNGTEMQVTEVVEGELQVQQEQQQQQQQQQQTVVCNDGEMVLVEGGEGEQQQQEEQEMQQQQEIQPEQEMHQEQEMDQEQEIQQQQEMQLQGQEMQLQGQEMQEQEMQLHEQEMQLHEQQHVEEEGAGQQQAGEVVAEHELHNVGTTQVMIQHGDGEEHEEIPLSQASILQTPEGIVFIQNPDGTTFQLQHNNQSIPLETVQALLAMETGDHTQYITGHVEQTE